MERNADVQARIAELAAIALTAAFGERGSPAAADSSATMMPPIAPLISYDVKMVLASLRHADRSPRCLFTDRK
jgi:hypothetical protein